MPWKSLAGEAFGNIISRFIGPAFLIFTLQGDSSPAYVKEATKKVKKKSSAEADYGKESAEHTKNKNKLNKHQKGQKRKAQDRGGEKGDVRRTRYK